MNTWGQNSDRRYSQKSISMCTCTVHAISVTDSWQAMFMSWNRNTDVFVIFNNVWPPPNVLVLLSTVRGGPRGSVDRCSPSCSVHPLLLLHVPCHYCLLQRWGPRGRGGEGKEGRRGREGGKEGKKCVYDSCLRECFKLACLQVLCARVHALTYVLGVGVYTLRVVLTWPWIGYSIHAVRTYVLVVPAVHVYVCMNVCTYGTSYKRLMFYTCRTGLGKGMLRVQIWAFVRA